MTFAAQAFGWLAALAGFAALALRDERRVRIGLIVHTVLYLVHFALLGLPVAVASNVVALLRLTLSLRYRSYGFVVVLSLAALIPGLLYGTGFITVLPMLASLVLTFVLFRCRGLALRFGILAGSLLWLIHNAAVGSWGGMAVEIGLSLSTLVGICRTWRTTHDAPIDRDT